MPQGQGVLGIKTLAVRGEERREPMNCSPHTLCTHTVWTLWDLLRPPHIPPVSSLSVGCTRLIRKLPQIANNRGDLVLLAGGSWGSLEGARSTTSLVVGGPSQGGAWRGGRGGFR